MRAAAILLLLAGPLLVRASEVSVKAKPELAISVSDKHPTIRRAVSIEVTATATTVQGVEINAVYRPNSKAKQEETISTKEADVSADGTKLIVRWTPTTEGIVLLTAKKDSLQATTSCAVRFDGMPALGVVIFIVAFFILFGGLAYAFVRGN